MNILDALENENNSFILNLTNKKIKLLKYEILKELSLSKKEIVEYMKKLKDYRYVDQMNELRYGGFIRWISIIDPTIIKLSNVGIFCELKIDDSGIHIIYTNFCGPYSNKKYYQFKMDECLIFQKINNQEKILLLAMDNLEN